MKKMNLVLRFSLLIVSVVIFFCMCTFGCEERNVVHNDTNHMEILDYANQFAEIHNEFLEYAFTCNDQAGSLKSANIDSKEELIHIANRFIKERSTNTLKKASIQNIPNIEYYFEFKSTEDIQDRMSERELRCAQRVMSLLSQFQDTESLEDLKQEAIHDVDLIKEQKYAICALISTAEKSYEFWYKRTNETSKLEKKNGLRKWWDNHYHIIGADIHMGWWATLGSGGNLLCGAVGAGLSSYAAGQ